MNLYSYVITRDYGFAPNPYFGYCTLATCKPRIRKTASIGDWIMAFGGKATPCSSKMVFLMRVDKIMTFDEYWNSKQYDIKKPVFNKSLIYAYGDNIYHHNGDIWHQMLSHHSAENGDINFINLSKDTSVDRILISNKFYYFGSNAIDISNEYGVLMPSGRGRGHRVQKNQELISEFLLYIEKTYEVGIHGTPFSRKTGEFRHFKGDI